MYFQKDYVLRMIEMLGELVRRICALERETDARKELDEICQKACGVPMPMLREADPDTLAGLLSEAQRYLAAELLMIDLEISSRGYTEDELLPIKAQALSLYLRLSEPDYQMPACAQVKRLVADNLGQFSAQLLSGAAEFFGQMGEFAMAEDALFAALEESPELRYKLEAFYTRLDTLSDKELQAGGLSRQELAEGRAALNS